MEKDESVRDYRNHLSYLTLFQFKKKRGDESSKRRKSRGGQAKSENGGGRSENGGAKYVKRIDYSLITSYSDRNLRLRMRAKQMVITLE